MKVEIERNILYDALNSGKKLKKNMLVKLPIAKESTVYGFVPYNETYFLNPDTIGCPPLGEATIIGNRLIYFTDKQIFRFPIFNSVSKLKDEKYNVYHLHVPRLMEIESGYKLRCYLNSVKKEKPDCDVWKVDSIKIIEDSAFYYPKEDEYLFETTTPFRAIANAFVVITRRISTDRGIVVYEVYDPKELEIID